jgi:hypothetical protein
LTKSKSSDPDDFSKSFFCEIKFEIRHDNQVDYKGVYCEDKSRTNDIEKLIQEKIAAKKLSWSTVPGNDFYISKEITESLKMADEIAGEAYNCASGDNYRPGFFSEISIQEEGIHLDQINHMNARSLDHKKDYSLRRLEFLLPLIPQEKKYPYEYQVGALLISFSDSSSENNKPCGKAVKAKIEALATKYDNE